MVIEKDEGRVKREKRGKEMRGKKTHRTTCLCILKCTACFTAVEEDARGGRERAPQGEQKTLKLCMHCML